MQNRLYAQMHQWTGRIILPVFVFVQTFAGPAVCADPAGVTVTGAPAPVADAIASNAPADAVMVDVADTNATVQLNFENTDITTVLLYLSEITGETILPDPRVKGTVTIINPKPVTPEQAKSIIYSMLDQLNCTVVKQQYLTKIIPSGEAMRKPIATYPPRLPSEMDAEDVLRAQVFYPMHISPKDVELFITPLMSAGSGKCIVHEPTGAIILIDTGANIKRLMDLIEIIDKVIEGGQVDIEIVKLEYADEKELVPMLQSIFSSPALQAPGTQKITMSGTASSGAPQPPTQPGAPPAPSTPPSLAPSGGDGRAEVEVKFKAQINFIAEPRMHAIIVVSPRHYMRFIKDMVQRLDVPSTEKDDVVHIYPLQHAEAEEISGTLNDIFSSGERTERTATVSRPDTTERPTTPTASRPGVTTPRSTPPEPTREISRPSVTTSSRQSMTSTQLAGKVDVIPHKISNSLIIITSPRYYEAVRRIIAQLDQRVPQVWIEAIIVEVSRDKNFYLGVGWKDMLDHAGSDVSLIQALDTAIGPALNDQGKIPRDSVGGVAYAFGTRDKNGAFDPYFTLQTSEGVTDVNVLSTPSILASNNEKAEISVGRTVPYQNYSTGTDTASVRDYSYSFLEINVTLSITPTINKYGEVAMETLVDVNEDGGRANPDDPNAPPITLSRKATTSVVVQDGQTLVIGGMIKDDFKTTINKVPVLGDIPILKYAFRTKQDTKTKAELMIFITPHVIARWAEGTELTTEVRNRYRGANGFLMNRDRAQLYDEVNTSPGELTLYDDWREFEKNVKDAETYFMMHEGKGVGTQPARPLHFFQRERERKPFEGELPPEPGTNEDSTMPGSDDTPLSPGGSIEPVGSTGSNRPTVADLITRERSLIGAEAVTK